MIINFHFDSEESYKLEQLRQQGVLYMRVIDDIEQPVGIFHLQTGTLQISRPLQLRDGCKLDLVVVPIEE